jgi:hypothetical protein
MNPMTRLSIPALAGALMLVAGGCGGSDSSTPTDTATEDTGPDLTDTIVPDTTPTDTIPADTTPADTTPPDTIVDTGTDTAGSGCVGDPCYTSTNCTEVPGAGRLCMNTVGGVLSFPGGYCSAVCTSAADCGTGGDCVDLFGIDNYCLKRCSSGTDCRTSEGYECTTLPGGTTTYCIPPSPDPETTTDY